MSPRATTLPLLALALIASNANAEEPERYHPYFKAPQVRTVDLAKHRAGLGQTPGETGSEAPTDLVQQGNVVVPAGVADGSLKVDHRPVEAVEDIPGNAYPRKHTVFLNFMGAELQVGGDNSAENRSSLARQGMYPAFTGSEATILAAVQAFENDVGAFGIRVRYDSRPRNVVPYTMVMVGGHWTDTNLEDSAAGVAPGTDCGALGQRHVVYTFADGGWGGTSIANVSSQEAGHAWGLDHSFNCSSVMAYCGGGNKFFSNTCDGVCEEQCQGMAGCFSTHEMFCGEGSDRQNEGAELAWIFGGNEPDMTPPIAEIVQPTDGATVEVGASVNLRAIVDDDYGGFGWKFILSKDGEVQYDEVDYDRDVDAMYRAALNLVNLEEGEYTLTVEVEDQYEHVTTDTVTLYVEPAAGDEGGEDEGGSDPTGDDSTSGSTTGDPSGEAGDGPTDDDEPVDDNDDNDDDDAESDTDSAGVIDDGAGGCRVGPEPTPAVLLLLLPVLLKPRRRRSNTSSGCVRHSLQ